MLILNPLSAQTIEFHVPLDFRETNSANVKIKFMQTKPLEVPKSFPPIGHKRWVIAEGYLPSTSHGPKPEMLSHETACILNTSDQDAQIEITIFYSDQEPIGPYKVSVPARRTKHIRFNELSDPGPIPRDIDYSSVIESSVPVVVQHTRLDSRQAENALMTTIAFADSESVM
jgi:hypothetical protein